MRTFWFLKLGGQKQMPKRSRLALVRTFKSAEIYYLFISEGNTGSAVKVPSNCIFAVFRAQRSHEPAMPFVSVCPAAARSPATCMRTSVCLCPDESGSIRQASGHHSWQSSSWHHHDCDHAQTQATAAAAMVTMTTVAATGATAYGNDGKAPRERQAVKAQGTSREAGSEGPRHLARGGQ